MAIDSLGFYNPYAALYSNGLNDDFMYNATICQPDATRVANMPYFTGLQYPQTDTFHRQNASLATGLKLGAVAGIGAGAGAYYFGGDKLGMNVFKNNKLNEDFINTLRKNNISEYKTLKESRKIIESLKDNPEELAKHIEENAALYDIQGDEAAIKKYAEKCSKKPEQFLRVNEQKINARRLRYEQINDLRAGKIKSVTAYFDKTNNALKENAPKYLEKAFNNFKIKKAGKVGLISAGIGIALNWLFG